MKTGHAQRVGDHNTTTHFGNATAAAITLENAINTERQDQARRRKPMSTANTQDSKQPAIPPLPASDGSVSWVNHEWDSENPACVRCGATMCLNDGCEWDDDPSLNLCHDCALALLREMTPND